MKPKYDGEWWRRLGWWSCGATCTTNRLFESSSTWRNVLCEHVVRELWLDVAGVFYLYRVSLCYTKTLPNRHSVCPLQTDPVSPSACVSYRPPDCLLPLSMWAFQTHLRLTYNQPAAGSLTPAAHRLLFKPRFCSACWLTWQRQAVCGL